MTDDQGAIIQLYAIWEPKIFTLMKIASSMYQGSMATELYDDRANDLGISEYVDVIEYEIDDNGSVHQLN